MIRYMDGLPQTLASISALCSADLPFLVQLLHMMKKGDVHLRSIMFSMQLGMCNQAPHVSTPAAHC